MESFVEDVLDRAAELGSGYLHLAAFLLAYGATALFVDLIVPGEVGLVVVGAVAARGGATLWTLIPVAALGATLGDTTSYWLGRRFGMTLIEKWEPVRRRLEPAVERAREHFQERGGFTVFFGRFVGALRAVVPAIAGMERMPFPRFLAWNAAASICWTTGILALGYFLGRFVKDIVSTVGLVVSGVVVATIVVIWFVRSRSAKRSAR